MHNIFPFDFQTSQDGGDTTSITSGIENEVKKATTGLAKMKRSSIKKKMQSFSHESDDGVIEPLLQKDKDKTDVSSQSAKLSLSKTKTDVSNDTMDDKEKLLPDNKVEKLPLASFSEVPENLINGTKEGYQPYTCVCTASAIHNHMNTNIFSNSDAIKKSIVPQSKILVEIDENKQGGYSSAPLIFTTAKIHTDGKTMQMEPVQVTPVPILSTIEGSVVKTSSFIEKQKANVGTMEKSSSFLPASSNVGKASEEINNVDFNLKTSSAIISYSKPEPKQASSKDFPKISSEVTKGLGNSKLPNLVTSAVKVCDSNVIITGAPKITTPTIAMQTDGKTFNKPPLVTKDVPKVQVSVNKGMTSTKQEIDVNKNFESPTCSTLPTINSIVEKDVAGKDKKDSSNIKQLQRQTNAVEEVDSKMDTKKSNIIHDIKTNVKEGISSTSKSPTIAACDTKNVINKKPCIIHDDISSKPSLLTQDKTLTALPVTSVTKTHPSSSKSITTVSTTMPSKISGSTGTPNVTLNTTTTQKPNVKSTTIVDNHVGKITTSTLTLSSIKSPTMAVTPTSSVSKNSLDSKSKTSTKVESVNNKALSSMDMVSTKVSPKNMTPVTNVNVESGAILIGKPTTKSLPSEPVITSDVTLIGKTSVSTSKPKITSTSSIASVGSVPKHISTTAPTIVSSNSIVKSNSVIPNKSNTSTDQVTGMSSKIRSTMSCSGTTGSSITKPSTSVANKTPSNISSSQTPVTTTKLVETTPKSLNASKKPSTSYESSKITQASNIRKSSDNQSVSTKGSSKTPTVVSPAAVVTTTSQKPSTINKSIDLRGNEHKKEKLK